MGMHKRDSDVNVLKGAASRSLPDGDEGEDLKKLQEKRKCCK